MSKYDALWKYIQENESQRFQLTFHEIAEITGNAIDHSFLKYKKELMGTGYQVDKISMKEQTVLFHRMIEDKTILLEHIDQIHTTEMGIDRIKRNLAIDTLDVVEYCKHKILDENCKIYKQGKNWYCEIDNSKITINSSSYTIITAHKHYVPQKGKSTNGKE